MQIQHVMQQLVLTNIPMDLCNFIIYIHCLPKVGQHAIYMLNSVLFASLYSSQGKRASKKFTECRTDFLFLTSLKTFYFFRSYCETNYFFQKNPSPPPEYQMVRPLQITERCFWLCCITE